MHLDKQNTEEVIAQAANIVKHGGVIAFPTDTFYGLGCDPFNEEAVERIFAIKQRRADMPLLLLIDRIETVSKLSSQLPDSFALIVGRFWPGPLTIIVPANDALPISLTAGTGTIGIRLPAAEFPRKLAAACGGAITATSANLSGGSNPLTADDVRSQLGDKPDLIIDGGTCDPIPSTIIDLCQQPPRILREGAIGQNDLSELIQNIILCRPTIRNDTK